MSINFLLNACKSEIEKKFRKRRAFFFYIYMRPSERRILLPRLLTVLGDDRWVGVSLATVKSGSIGYTHNGWRIKKKQKCSRDDVAANTRSVSLSEQVSKMCQSN